MTASPPPSATGQAPSSASPRQSSAQPGQSHTRTYQACIPCRRRKVRCDLGPVDNPHDPPCVRCRRESKDCFFSATRRKRKPVDAGEGIEDDGPSDYEVRNGRKRLRAEDSLTPQRQPSITMSMSQYNTGDEPPRPVTPGGSIGRYQPLRRPAGHHGSTHEEEQKVNNDTAAILQSHEVYSGHDALNLLFEAAGRTGDMDHHRTGSTSSVPRPPTSNIPTPGSQPSLTSPSTNPGRPYPSPIARPIQEPAIDPAIAQGYPDEEQDNEAEYQEALRAWSRFRFVRAGWFTAKEGVAYMDYFYRYLSPLTPIVVPNFEHYSTHVALLTEEPMLTITLLTVSSRYMSLTGPGASSRPFAIHEKLWHYLQGMIDRTIWGQEQFGGGFCGAGAQQGSDINPLSRTGLRTLGTVESLMLLTEWHPRALHFPPGDDDDELMTPDDTITQGAHSAAHPTIQRERYRGVGGQRIDSWLEPCWRSDRMCWMLLGNALALAYEIGVFDEKSETEFQAENRYLPPTKVEAYFRRKNHLRELLLIYITQTSGRVGITSMLPRSQRDISFLKTPDERLQERFANLKRSGRIFRGDSGVSAPSPGTQKLIDSQEMVLYFWMEIAAIMERGNQEMFANRRATRDLITTGEYKQLLHKFQPLLRDYREHLDKWRHVIPKLMCDILSIEFEYSRVYLNSLALQAVVVRCTHHNTMQDQSPAPSGAPQEMVSAPLTKNGAIPAASLIKWYGDDHFYIKEVVDGCRNVLTIVIKGLEPGGYLKHAPVRTFFRIISVAIILLKTFVLGATEDEVAISIGLMEEAVSALRSCIVDDVHVGNRFADLLMTLIVTIKARFVRMINSASGKASLQASRAGSRSPVTQSAGPMGGINDNDKLRQQAPMMPPPQPGQTYGNSQWGGVNYGNGMGMPQSPSIANDPNGRSSSTLNVNHPLWGISTETYDPGTNNISIMPPPTFGSPYQTNQHLPDAANHFGGVGDSGGGYGGGYGMNGQDWLALPLDPLLASYGADVSNTTYGPDVGGYDLLDVLLNGVDGASGPLGG